MKYEVRCECGNAHEVSAADAGSALRCACGRTVDVPPLHLLRTTRGRGAISPLAQVRSALLNGLLPGTRTCSLCGCDTSGHCRVKVLCEHVPNNSGPRQAEVVGCLLGPYFFGWLFTLLLVTGLRGRRKSAGDEEAIVVPLPICEICRPKLDDPNALQTAVRRIPDYAALLQHYPKAEIALVG
jgi:hypothetical protein